MWQSLIKRYNVQAPGAAAGAAPVASPLGPAGSASPKTPAPAAASPKTPAPKKSASAAKDASPKKAAEKEPAAEKEKASPARKPSMKKSAPQAAPAQQTAAAPSSTSNSPDVAADQRVRLMRYFGKHMPDKVGQVDAIVAKMVATDKNGEAWANMWKAFTSRFGPEDPPPTVGKQQPPQRDVSETSSAAEESMSSPPPQSAGSKFAGLHRPKPINPPTSNDPSESGVTSSSVFSPTRIDNDLAGEGSISIKKDASQRKAAAEAVKQEWVQRISRFLAHYDAPKTDEEILAAVNGADSTSEGMQEMWETLLEHYGPEPPQPLSSMMRVMDAEQKRKTPQQAAQSLIFGEVSNTTKAPQAKSSALPPAQANRDIAPSQKQSIGLNSSSFNDGMPVGAALPLSNAASQSNAAKKKAWYLDDEETGGVSASTRGGRGGANRSNTFRDAAQSGNLAFHDSPFGHNNNQDDVNRVPPNALVIYGVLRLIGVQYDLYARATGPAQHQFVRALEQEISFNIDCDPSAVTVRRMIPNVAIDFKIDLTDSVSAGTTDRRTAQRIGDILVNRVLNGTFTLRLIRDSYRRDLGGIPTDLFTQSCAVFGSEAQQYYTLVPDEDNGPAPPVALHSNDMEAAVAGGYTTATDSRNYAAVAAAPMSRTMKRDDVFGTSPSPHRSGQRGGGAQPRTLDASIEQWTNRLHNIAEQDRAGLGGWNGANDFTERWLAGVRPPPGGTAADSLPQRLTSHVQPLGGNGNRGGDFGARMWDDTASELADYQRREETAQYDLQKPEAINGAMSWNRILSGFEDPATAASRRPVGLQHVAYNPRVHTGMAGVLNDYSPLPKARGGVPPSQMDLQGLQRLKTVGLRSGGGGGGPVFGGGAGRQTSSSPTRAGGPFSPGYRGKYERGNSSSPTSRSHLYRSPIAGGGAGGRVNPSRSPPRQGQGRVVSGPRSLVEPPVASSSYNDIGAGARHSASSYQGFGHSNPSVRAEMERRFDGTPQYSSSYGGETYMEREGRRARAFTDARLPAGGIGGYAQQHTSYGSTQHHSPNGNVWPVDGFSREFNSIVRSM
ncbi:Hypothetical protein, putative [Bodo saltans]|uniref:Uncharacterized protein n=1 Tax=Bodo saltans TaxID=75058 RepID=A0A0S4JFM7_BODSA|nr:Hypothetical protein, putative [Bodo saltans]|eukprot:CUG87188.1 Hypothetical protein, putative [Bodo saltans]